mgnify:FL=1
MRIMIFGRPGSGKTTFAYELSKKLNLPLYHLDKYFFTANWVQRDYQEFLSIQQELVNQEDWIIDGNSLQSLEMRYARTQICIYFNYPRYICLWRLLKRRFFKDPKFNDLAEGCPPNVRWQLIKYTWTFETRLNNRLITQLAELKSKYPEVKFIEVKNDKDKQKLFNQL